MKTHTDYMPVGLCLAALFGPLNVRAATTNLNAVADTFIVSSSPGNNAGGHAWFDAGTDGSISHGVRRGLLRFDLSGIPPGSTVTSALVRLTVVKVPGIGGVNSTFDLFQLRAGWAGGGRT